MDALGKAINHVGSTYALASALGIGQSIVSMWKSRGGVVPLKYCTAIEQVTGGAVTRRDLRPDDWRKIWPELARQDDQPAIQAETVTSPEEEAA